MLKQALAVAISAAILAGCTTTVSTKPLTGDELQAAATAELAKMFSPGQVIDRGLDESEVVYRAVMNNLDTRLRRLESSFALSQLQVDNLAMLPSLALNAGYSNRSNDSYSTSQPLGNAGPTGAFSRSSSDEVTTGSLTASWNVLDFALGYYNAKQSAERALIANERERRAGMDLVRQAKSAYWRAYAAQKLNDRVAENIKSAENALITIKRGEAQGAIAPMDALRQRKTVLESIRQLSLLKQDLDRSVIELSQIVNSRPGEKLELKELPLTELSLSSSLEELEQRAYEFSPDIREQKYRERIAMTDVKKVSASLFPSLGVSAGLQTSSDEFLQSGEWATYGLNVGWNLIQLANASTLNANAKLGVEVEHARALAVRMAVLAKTHIAYRDFKSSKEQFERAQELYLIEKQLAEQNRARVRASAGTEVDQIVSETSEILAELRLYQTYAGAVGALETVSSTVGDDTGFIAVLEERRTRIGEAETKIAEAQKVISDSVVSLEMLAKNENDSKAELLKLKESKFAARNETTAIESQRKVEAANLKSAEAQLDSAQRQLEDVDQQIVEIAAALKEARKEALDAGIERDGAQASQLKATAELNQLATQREAAVGQLIALNAEETAVFGAQLKGEVKDAEATLAKLGKTREQLMQRVETLSNDSSDKQREVLEYQLSASKIDQVLAANMSEQQGLEARRQLLVTQKNSLTQQIMVLESEINRVEDYNVSSKARLIELEELVTGYENRESVLQELLSTISEERAKTLEKRAEAEESARVGGESLNYLRGTAL